MRPRPTGRRTCRGLSTRVFSIDVKTVNAPASEEGHHLLAVRRTGGRRPAVHFVRRFRSSRPNRFLPENLAGLAIDAKTTRCPPLRAAEVRKTRSPKITGDDCPLPGSSVFQTTDFSSHFTGTLASTECPSLAGPRHCGQSPSALIAVGHSHALIKPTNNHCRFAVMELFLS